MRVNPLNYTDMDAFIDAKNDAEVGDSPLDDFNAYTVIWGILWTRAWAPRINLIMDKLGKIVAEDSDARIAASVRSLIAAMKEPIDV